MSNKHIPCFPVNIPNGGPQKPPMMIPTGQPVYSDYTGNLIGMGPIPYGVRCDAPITNKNYGKDFHGVLYVNGYYVAHDPMR